MTDDLRALIREALNTTPAGFVQQNPEALEFHRTEPWFRHDRHQYMGSCALCRGETDPLVDAVMAVLDAAGVSPEAVARLTAERDEAREGAHQLDQSRPTNWAYEQACAAIEKHRARADAAEASLRAAATVKCWTNEDGRRFVFADDLADALGVDVAERSDADELVSCSGLHCTSRMFFGRLEARGWVSGGMGTWLCPNCQTTTKETGS